jgi:eukaryotic-like serine/threonine-protein kinase
MARLSDLADVLVGCRVTTRDQWEQAARAGRGDLARILAHLASEPPDWWDGKTPAPPGLTDYQREAITARVATNEFGPLRRDLAVNQFLLLDKLGLGGQGEVFRGLQRNPARFVAVKTLIRDTETGRQRFEREARAMMKIQHPAVARFYLYERVRNAAGEPTHEYLIAMEFVDGTDIHRLVRASGVMPWPFVARWAVELLGGLMVIHQNGFIHRDIKPRNVMVAGPTPGPDVAPQETSVKLLDFGAVKRADEEIEAKPGARVFIGTREFAPPEQWGGQVVPESDLYALGGTLYSALTGRAPYQKEGREAKLLMKAHATEPIPNAAEFNPDVPDGLNRLLQRLMAKRPEDRGTAAGLIEEFRQLLRGESGAEIPPPSAPTPPPARPKPAVVSAAELRAATRRESEPRNPVSRALEPVLGALERFFIPGHLRPAPGHEPALPERVAALLRRPSILLALALLVILLVVLAW